MRTKLSLWRVTACCWMKERVVSKPVKLELKQCKQVPRGMEVSRRITA